MTDAELPSPDESAAAGLAIADSSTATPDKKPARNECAVCRRPQVGCYCNAVTKIETRTRVLILQHPREHEKAVNTARIAELALPNAELVVGFDFSTSRIVEDALNRPEHPAVLLYPGPDARDLEHDPPRHPVTLVVVDGTWNQARSLLRKNPHLLALPHYAFRPESPSEYRIRREPRPEYVSTIEALACALPHLESDPARFQKLLEPFRAMVDVQVSYAARSSGGRRRLGRRKAAKARSRLPELLLSQHLVCVMGEANAFPYRRTSALPSTPHELVHWLGVRLDNEHHFEGFAMPRGPLASSPFVHARIPEERLRAAGGIEELVLAYEAFSGADDVLCSWGHYANALYVRERGAPFPRVLDMRKIAGDHLKRRPGSLEGLIAEQAIAWQPMGTGSGGERLGMLVALTRWLVDEAHLDGPTQDEPSSAES